jgi:hypothetical protein
VTPIPIATFLAGSLLTILLPLAVLLALSLWYMLFLRHVPDPGLEPSTADARRAATAAAPPEGTETRGEAASGGGQRAS